MFHLMFVHYTFSSVKVAEWEIAARLVGHLVSLSFVYLLYLFISRFGFKSEIWLLIAPVPAHCFSITYWALRPRSTAEVMSGRSVILSTLFLGKPPRGRLPELSAHPFVIN